MNPVTESHLNIAQLSSAHFGTLRKTDPCPISRPPVVVAGSNCIQSVSRLSKRCLRLLAMVPFFGLLLTNSPAALLFYEGFNYLNGEELGKTTISSPPWENHKNQFTVAPGSLKYASIQAATGNHLKVATTGLSLDSVRTAPNAWIAQSNGTLYVSFLLRIESLDGIATTGNGTSLLTISKTSNNGELFGINLLNQDGVKLGVLKYPSNSSPVSSAFFTNGPGSDLSTDGSTTYLIVAKYQWVDGPNNNLVAVWIDPDLTKPQEEPSLNISTSNGADGTQTAGRLTLCRGPSLNIDEIRIGQTWTDVTPISASKSALEATTPSATQASAH